MAASMMARLKSGRPVKGPIGPIMEDDNESNNIASATIQRAAGQFNVSERSVKRAKRVVKGAPPNVVEMVRDGAQYSQLILARHAHKLEFVSSSETGNTQAGWVLRCIGLTSHYINIVALHVHTRTHSTSLSPINTA